MAEYNLMGFLAGKLGVPRKELGNAAYRQRCMEELLKIPDRRFSIMDWSVTLTFLLRGNYCFGSVEEAKATLRSELNVKVDTARAPAAKRTRKILGWGIPCVFGLSIYLLMQFVFIFCFVTSASMEPAYPESSFVFGLRLCGDYTTGDAIIFKHDDTVLLKRIAAGPKETVYIDDRTGAYATVYFSGATRTLSIPAGSFFVVGDNLRDSYDSRFWADCFVAENDIIAKALF